MSFETRLVYRFKLFSLETELVADLRPFESTESVPESLSKGGEAHNGDFEGWHPSVGVLGAGRECLERVGSAF